MDNDDDVGRDVEAWLAARPTLVQERGHAQHWFNRASDLRASAGALWFTMERDRECTERLGLGHGFSMNAACTPVFYMLCGLALELIMKARLVRTKGHTREIEHHQLNVLAEALGEALSSKDRELLQFYEAAMVWAGRYPLPRNPTDQKLRRFSDLASAVLTEPVPDVAGIELRWSSSTASWDSFHALWTRHAELFFDERGDPGV